MSNLKYISSMLLLIGLMSCDKHVIEYDAEAISGVAEFQLHYFVPVTSGAANNIYKVEINDQLYANDQAALTTYNAIPGGSVGRFYTTGVGATNIKLYQGTDLNLVYDQNCTLTEGKQNIFVYDFDEPPVVIDNGFPYVANVTEHSDTTAWIKFYNFLFEEDDQLRTSGYNISTSILLSTMNREPLFARVNGPIWEHLYPLARQQAGCP